MYPTNRVECVYDRCAYRKCKNGKYYNGKHLFRFPVETDPRHKVWIKNSGNHLLRVWSASTIRRSGLCEDHFSPDSFVNEKRQRLKRNAIPLPYNDSLQAVQNTAIKKEVDTNVSTLIIKEEINVIKDKEEEEAIHQGNKLNSDETVKEEEKIIEEDILVYEIYEETDDIEDTSKDQGNVVIENNPTIHQTEEKSDDNDGTDVMWKNNLRRTYSSQPLPRRTTADKDNPMGSADIESFLFANIVQTEKATTLPVNVKEINDKDVIIDSLKKENNFLRQQMQLLKMKLRRNLRKVQAEKTSHQGNDFLNRYMNELGLEPIAKAMIKLQLHKPNTLYTEDEKLLTKQLYYHSATALSELRKAGCNIPPESVIEKWMTEHDQS